ncbi:MAG: hypothetical protein H6851_05680 [Geminicoccaceae bacterium]|nr:hypothetical protein [Geminicoccaceae bacterium]
MVEKVSGYRRTGGIRAPGSLLGVAMGILCGCGAMTDGLDPQVERSVRDYYEKWAVENRALCTNPRMNAITRVNEVSRNADRIEVNLRYDVVGGVNAEDPSRGGHCHGFNDRRFVLTHDDRRWNVTYMSGWQHKNAGLDLGPVNLGVHMPPVLGGVIYNP